MVRVPGYRPSTRTRLRAWVDRTLYSTEFETLAACVAVALGVVLVLTLPRFHIPIALVLLSMLATLYPERIRRAWLGGEELKEARRRPWWRRWLSKSGRFAVGLMLVLACVGPLWLGQQSTLFAGAGDARGILVWLVAIILWILVPMLCYLALASDENGRVGSRRALLALGRQPAGSGLVLLSFPIAMIALEVLTVLFLSIMGWMMLWVFDLFPMSDGVVRELKTVRVPSSIEGGQEGAVWLLYWNGLRQGANMIAANPLSLHNGLKSNVAVTAFASEFGPALMALQDLSYLFARMSISLVVISTGMAVLAAQSYWLGRIGSKAPQERPMAVKVMASR